MSNPETITTDGLYYSSDGNVYDAAGGQVGSYTADSAGQVSSVSMDTNQDNVTDVTLADTDADGYAESAEVDTDLNGVADTFITDTDLDGDYDSGLVDTDGDAVADTAVHNDAGL